VQQSKDRRWKPGIFWAGGPAAARRAARHQPANLPIWRRVLVRGDTSIVRLHQILQITFGWQDMHLHRFESRGREYGADQESGVAFDTDAHKALIGVVVLFAQIGAPFSLAQQPCGSGQFVRAPTCRREGARLAPAAIRTQTARPSPNFDEPPLRRGRQFPRSQV
jgi:Plasmid pRiA4b ORF-3-like protein